MSDVHKILKLIDEESRRPRSQEECDAARRLNLGHGTIREWFEAKSNSRQR
jgi:hypothetical protein